MTDASITADPIIVSAEIDAHVIVRAPSGRHLKSQMKWRDAANNIWHTTLYADDQGIETSQLDLIQASNPASLPAEPVPVPVSPHAPNVMARLVLPKDIGLKTKISPQGTSGVKVGHIFFTDAAHNIWFSENYKDAAGDSWTTNTLTAAAVPGAAPAVPVTA